MESSIVIAKPSRAWQRYSLLKKIWQKSFCGSAFWGTVRHRRWFSWNPFGDHWHTKTTLPLTKSVSPFVRAFVWHPYLQCTPDSDDSPLQIPSRDCEDDRPENLIEWRMLGKQSRRRVFSRTTDWKLCHNLWLRIFRHSRSWCSQVCTNFTHCSTRVTLGSTVANDCKEKGASGSPTREFEINQANRKFHQQTCEDNWLEFPIKKPPLAFRKKCSVVLAAMVAWQGSTSEKFLVELRRIRFDGA